MKELVREDIKNIIRFLKVDWKVEEFRDKVADWWYFSHFLKLQEDFIYEFRDKLDINELINRELITQKRLKKLEKEELKEDKFTRFEIMEI